MHFSFFFLWLCMVLVMLMVLWYTVYCGSAGLNLSSFCSCTSSSFSSLLPCSSLLQPFLLQRINRGFIHITLCAHHAVLVSSCPPLPQFKSCHVLKHFKKGPEWTRHCLYMLPLNIGTCLVREPSKSSTILRKGNSSQTGHGGQFCLTKMITNFLFRVSLNFLVPPLVEQSEGGVKDRSGVYRKYFAVPYSHGCAFKQSTEWWYPSIWTIMCKKCLDILDFYPRGIFG